MNIGQQNNDNVFSSLLPEQLGSSAFRQDHGVKYAYVAGAMYKGIASVALVSRMAKAGLLAYFGTGGLSLERIEQAIVELQSILLDHEPFGMNFLANMIRPQENEALVSLYLKYGIRRVEASAFMAMTPSIVRYRLTGIYRDKNNIIVPNKVMAKVSRAEVVSAFLKPPAKSIVSKLLKQGLITEQEAELSQLIPMADDICAEADSGGHTDKRVAHVLLPPFLKMRDKAHARYPHFPRVRMGVAGGLGTPDAIAAVFLLGADFVLTGSINQCTPEANTSDAAKDLLAAANMQDMDMAPAGDMFEVGSKIQVLNRGTLFAFRGNRLYELYRQYDSWESIDASTRSGIEKDFFHRSYDVVWQETKDYFSRVAPKELANFEKHPKSKFAAVLRWYFIYSSRLAKEGDISKKSNFQIHTGPAVGAFNQYVKGSDLADWRTRHVDIIANELMQGAATHITQYLQYISTSPLSSTDNRTDELLIVE